MTGIIRWLKKFWQCRKQDDRVKIMLIFSLTGAGFLIYAAHTGIQVCTMLRTPVEYVLSGDGNMNGIEAIQDVAAVSLQKQTPLTLSGTWGELTVDCLELSESYLSRAYGITETTAMKVIYLNQMAYDQLLTVSKMEESIGYTENFRVSYLMGDEEETGEAKLRVLTEGIPNQTACAFCAASNGRLSAGENTVRVQMARHELDGMNLYRLTQLGFHVVNAYDVQQTSTELEMQFLRIKYSCLVAGLCLLAVVSLKKYGRHL